MAGHAARERELTEELRHALGVLADVAVALGVGALQPGTGVGPGPAVTGAGDEHGVQRVLGQRRGSRVERRCSLAAQVHR